MASVEKKGQYSYIQCSQQSKVYNCFHLNLAQCPYLVKMKQQHQLRLMGIVSRTVFKQLLSVH